MSDAARPGRFLVTGASGFIGRHLVRALLGRAALVRCLSRSRPAPPGAEAATADLADPQAMLSAMRGVDIVLHLGAMASVATAASAPAEAFRANTLGTQNVLEAARLAGVRRVVVLSTAHVFGRPAQLPLTEEQPLSPLSSYAATKLAGDVIAMGYDKGCGLPVTVLRPMNVYGPGQDVEAVIPTIVSQALSHHRIGVRDPSVRRDFTYVEDIVDAILAAAASPGAAGREMLLASGIAVSVGTIMRRVASLTGACTIGLQDGPDESGDCLYGSAQRARALLGWTPKVDLDEGLARTVAWWRERRAAGETARPAS